MKKLFLLIGFLSCLICNAQITVLPVKNGGTGISTYTVGQLLFATGATTLTPAIPTLNSSAGTFTVSTAGQFTFPDASGSTRGFLNSTDWNTFNNKQNALTFNSPLSLSSNTVSLNTVPVNNGGTGVTSSINKRIWFSNGDNTFSQSSKFLWDDANYAQILKENTKTGWQISTRSQSGTGLQIPVATFRADSVNQNFALDISPRGTPGNYIGQGVTWLDLMNKDIKDSAVGNSFSARIGCWTDHVEIGSRPFGGHANVPVNFTVGSNTVATMDASGNWTTNGLFNIASLGSSQILYQNGTSVVGNTGLTYASSIITTSSTVNGSTGITSFNSNSGSSTQNQISAGNGTHNMIMGAYGTSWSSGDLRVSDEGYIYTSCANGILFGTTGGTGQMKFVAGGVASGNEIMRYDASGLSVLTRTTATAYLDVTGGTASLAAFRLQSQTSYTGTTDGVFANNSSTHNIEVTLNSTKYVLGKGFTGSDTLDFPSTAALASSDLTITVTGAADGDPVYIGVPNGSIPAGTNMYVYSAWVSSANTVTVRFQNHNAVGAVDPASGTFKVFINKN